MQEEDVDVCESACQDEHPSRPPSTSSSSTVPLGLLTAHTPVSQENHGAIPCQKSTASICLQRWTNNPFKTLLRSQEIEVSFTAGIAH